MSQQVTPIQVVKPKSIMNYFGKQTVTPASSSQNLIEIESKKMDGIASGEDKFMDLSSPKKVPVSNDIAAVEVAVVGEEPVVDVEIVKEGLAYSTPMETVESESASSSLAQGELVEEEKIPVESSSTKKPRKKNNALKALESYNNTGGKEVMAEKRVAVQVDYSDASLSAIDALLKGDDATVSAKSPKTTIAASVVNAYFTAEGSAAACSFDSIAPSVAGHVATSGSVSSAMAMEKVLRELPAEVVAKITLNRDRMTTLLGEMTALESASDLCDQNLDLQQAMGDVVQFITSVAKEVVVTVPDVSDVIEETNGAGALESASEGVEEQAATVTNMPSSPPVTESSSPADPLPPVTASTPAVEVKPVETSGQMIDTLLRTVVTRSAQGSALNKPALAVQVLATLASLVERINTACETITQISGSDLMGTVLTDIEDLVVRAVVERQQRVVAVINDDSLDAGPLIDLLFTRKQYGNPLVKGSIEECMEATAGWRWVTSYPATYLTKAGQNVVREVTSVRTRYQRAMRAVAKVVEDLSSESSTLNLSEERCNKALLEVEKAKERRRELETKRNAEATEKAAREALKEQKRREKEEQDLKKKQAAAEKAEATQAAKEAAALLKAQMGSAEKEKKVHVPSEKELKAAKALELQKNSMKGFFAFKAAGTPSPSTVFNKPGRDSTTSSLSSSAASLKPLRPIVFTASAPIATTSSVSIANNSSSSSSSEVICLEDNGDVMSVTASSSTPLVHDEDVQIVPAAKSQALLDFETQLQRGMSTSELMQAYRSNAESRAPKAKKHRRRGSVKLYVTVHLGATTSSANAFSGEQDQSYSEIRERLVDKRMRTLSFAEDHRPAYVGTITKRSRVISGRRPCAKDEELINYDFDSEGEWEEEVEGEDIGDSGDEMDSEDGDRNAANELVYDDYFVRDNDYGSDAESDADGDMAAAAVHSGREKEEVLGVRFISSSHRVSFPLGQSDVKMASAVKSYRIEANQSSDSVSSPVSIAYTSCSDRDIDTQRLSQYTAVLFPTLANGGMNTTPFLGKVHNNVSNEEVTSSGKKAKKRKSESGETAVAAESLIVEATTEGEQGAETDGKFKTFDESKLADLVKLVHGSKDGGDKLVGLFHTEIAPHVPKTQIKKRLLEVAEKVKHAEGHGSQRWCVKNEVFEALQQAPSALEFTPLKKKKARIEPTKVVAAVVPGGDGSVSGFINTFMPPELLVAPTPTAVSSSSAPPAVSSAAVLATPKKEGKSVTTQFNKITAFVKPSASVVDSVVTSSSVDAVEGSPSLVAVKAPVVAPVIHTLVAKKKSSKKVSPPAATTTTTKTSSDVKSAPEIIDLL